MKARGSKARGSKARGSKARGSKARGSKARKPAEPAPTIPEQLARRVSLIAGEATGVPETMRALLEMFDDYRRDLNDAVVKKTGVRLFGKGGVLERTSLDRTSLESRRLIITALWSRLEVQLEVMSTAARELARELRIGASPPFTP